MYKLIDRIVALCLIIGLAAAFFLEPSFYAAFIALSIAALYYMHEKINKSSKLILAIYITSAALVFYGLSILLKGYIAPGLVFSIYITASAIFLGTACGFCASFLSLIALLFICITNDYKITYLAALLVITAFFALAAMTGRNSDFAEKQQREKKNLSFLLDFNKLLTACNTIEDMASLTSDKIYKQFGLCTSIILTDEQDNMKLLTEMNNPINKVDLETQTDFFNKMSWETFQAKKILRIDNPCKSPAVPPKLHRLLSRYTIKAVPMKNMHDMIGIIILYKEKKTEYIGNEDETIILGVADILARALANLELIKKFKHAALIDELTGLYNRRSFFLRFNQEVNRANRYGQQLGFTIFDIDNFKKINDKHGHPAGDKVLRQLSDIAMSSIRDIDFVARIGGEEFAVITMDSSVDDTYQIIERIREKVSTHDFGLDSDVTISAGIAVFPSHGKTAEDLFAKADNALYEAKGKEKNIVLIA